MPNAMLKLCRWPGCPELVKGRFCEPHQTQSDRQRGTSTQRGYGVRWRRFRQWFINQLIALGIPNVCGARLPGAAQTMHSQCAAKGVLEPGTHVDHIVPHKGNDGLMFDPLNLQLLCAACHDRKTATEDGGFGR